MPADRLAAQLRFLVEIDKLKAVLRQSLLTCADRRENSAEHSWHLAMLALVLHEHAAEPVDLGRVLAMCLVHDLVEIDAGDTYVYDAAAQAGRAERERRAADRVFGLLPAGQGAELRGLWDEFEARTTPDARFAAALDRLQPMLQNYYSDGRSWQAHGIAADQVLAVNAHIAAGAPALWEVARDLVADAVRRGWLRPGP